jgi:hypothetical protein
VYVTQTGAFMAAKQESTKTGFANHNSIVELVVHKPARGKRHLHVTVASETGVQTYETNLSDSLLDRLGLVLSDELQSMP